MQIAIYDDFDMLTKMCQPNGNEQVVVLADEEINDDMLKMFKGANICDLAGDKTMSYNPCKVPVGVNPREWTGTLMKLFSFVYGLLERGQEMLGAVVNGLYEETGVFAAYDAKEPDEVVSALSEKVDLVKIYQALREKEDTAESWNKEGYNRLAMRFSWFEKPQTDLRAAYAHRREDGTCDGKTATEFVGNQPLTVIRNQLYEVPAYLPSFVEAIMAYTMKMSEEKKGKKDTIRLLMPKEWRRHEELAMRVLA